MKAFSSKKKKLWFKVDEMRSYRLRREKTGRQKTYERNMMVGFGKCGASHLCYYNCRHCSCHGKHICHLSHKKRASSIPMGQSGPNRPICDFVAMFRWEWLCLAYRETQSRFASNLTTNWHAQVAFVHFFNSFSILSRVHKFETILNTNIPKLKTYQNFLKKCEFEERKDGAKFLLVSIS